MYCLICICIVRKILKNIDMQILLCSFVKDVLSFYRSIIFQRRYGNHCNELKCYFVLEYFDQFGSYIKFVTEVQNKTFFAIKTLYCTECIALVCKKQQVILRTISQKTYVDNHILSLNIQLIDVWIKSLRRFKFDVIRIDVIL